MTEEENSCETCKFYIGHGNLAKIHGDCRRRSPRAGIHPTQIKFPHVEASDWCGEGEWKPEYSTDVPDPPKPPPPIDIVEGDDRPAGSHGEH